MFDAGMTRMRLNLSHSSLETSQSWIQHYFDAASQTGKEKKLMIDLIGPELRIGNLEGNMGLSNGAHVGHRRRFSRTLKIIRKSYLMTERSS